MSLSPQVLYEDNHLLIVNKPAGILSQSDRTGDTSLVDFYKDYIKVKYNKPGAVFLGLVHRLDRPVSGAVTLARTSKSLERMNQSFKERKVEKIYWAIVNQRPPREQGELEHWLVKDRKKNQVRAFQNSRKGAQKAELTYELKGRSSSSYLLEIKPVTGRPHQIRVQLKAMGCPIQGDLKYGATKPNRDGNISLHAGLLRFEHPVKKDPIHIQAPLPKTQEWKELRALVE